MREDLERLARQADILGRDFDDVNDMAQVNYLIGLLGEFYPASILEQVVKHYQGKLKDIENKQIPDVLMELELAMVKTTDGLSVGLKTEYTVSVLDPDYLCSWMETRGGGHLWKTALKFEKGEPIEAVIKKAEELGLSYERKSEIHPMTLKKFVKDYVEGGTGEGGIPETAAQVSMFTHATIKRN